MEHSMNESPAVATHEPALSSTLKPESGPSPRPGLPLARESDQLRRTESLTVQMVLLR